MNNIEKYLDNVIQQKPINFEPPTESNNETTPNIAAAILRRWRIAFLTLVVMCSLGIPAIWLLVQAKYVVVGALRVAPIIPNILTGESEK